jgi:hypothetical protein
MRIIVILLSYLAIATAFAPAPVLRSAVTLKMGFFDELFGGAKKAKASHILLKGPNAATQCEKLKIDIYKKAIGRGSAEDGVSGDALMAAVSTFAVVH